MKLALEVDPLSLYENANLGWHLHIAGRPDEAIKQLKITLEMDPNYFMAHFDLGEVYRQKKMYREAIAAFQKAISLSNGSPAAIAELGHTYAVAGNKEEAKRVIDKLKELIKQNNYVSSCDIAVIYAGLGEKDEAFVWLETAYQQRDGWLAGHLKTNPRFDSLRSDPRFQDLAAAWAWPTRPPRGDQPIDTLAVLPFDNQSPDPEAGYLGDDITYSLTDSLMRVRELNVRPYGSAARYKPGSFDAKTAGRELQVQAVLRGSIQKRGDEIIDRRGADSCRRRPPPLGRSLPGQAGRPIGPPTTDHPGGAREAAAGPHRPGEAGPGQAAHAEPARPTSFTSKAASNGTNARRQGLGKASTFSARRLTKTRTTRWPGPAWPRPIVHFHSIPIPLHGTSCPKRKLPPRRPWKSMTSSSKPTRRWLRLLGVMTGTGQRPKEDFSVPWRSTRTMRLLTSGIASI